MSDKKSTTLTPKAQHPEHTQKFVSLVAEALEVFKDNIASLEENLQASTYEAFIKSYKDALLGIWSPAAATDTKMILKNHYRQTTNITQRHRQKIGAATTRRTSIPGKAKDPRSRTLDIDV